MSHNLRSLARIPSTPETEQQLFLPAIVVSYSDDYFDMSTLNDQFMTMNINVPFAWPQDPYEAPYHAQQPPIGTTVATNSAQVPVYNNNNHNHVHNTYPQHSPYPQHPQNPQQ
ncbi:hypothetical protein BGX23_007935 [Mortierella sp. AD031]|nr:hypothetical protein BGX23_007935 [Mortierella sp. AD031]KAG0215831.1 hypothetical protein BGX33_000824 [Mortierella sp. NVP41]